MSNVIEKQIEVKAPLSRVWRALTDSKEFGEWFRVKLEGPFAPGKVTRGRILSAGFEHVVFEVTVQKMEPERLFSYTWHPYAIDPKKDYSKEPATLVAFTLEAKGDKTIVTITETGFDALPKDRAFEAFRMNEGGWEAQMKNVARYVAG
jgi:uncharacterized protein YndB with AHSA1/START domain